MHLGLISCFQTRTPYCAICWPRLDGGGQSNFRYARLQAASRDTLLPWLERWDVSSLLMLQVGSKPKCADKGRLPIAWTCWVLLLTATCTHMHTHREEKYTYPCVGKPAMRHGGDKLFARLRDMAGQQQTAFCSFRIIWRCECFAMTAARPGAQSVPRSQSRRA